MNNLENKAKFFAQHWGQQVLKNELINKAASTIDNNSIIALPQQYLQLKPLSIISDEDAIEVAKLTDDIYVENVYDQRHLDGLLYWGKKYVQNIEKRRTEFTLYQALKVTDYLRSKGYALPWNGISVEDQIKWKWVKLIEK